MTDETGTEIAPSDVLSVEEFLFGDAADDASAEVAGDGAIEEVEGDAAAVTAEEPDADRENAEEPNVADYAGDEDASPDELKVVLSIRGGRATIGVQCPASDPHIESFDDPDLFGLADEFPAAVARARAKWEEEPRYPAYVKLAPPARPQRQHRQESAQPATEEGEAEQQQPETLRLF